MCLDYLCCPGSARKMFRWEPNLYSTGASHAGSNGYEFYMTALERLKILINSSTPIVVMETVEEMRALSLVREACSGLNLAIFEWTIADGLVRSGSGVGPTLRPGLAGSDLRLRPDGSDSSASPKTAMYHTTDPVEA